ncbi:MAG: dTDP-glucose 4,6-dehydratase, partial [Duncaniella sp.]|nr:dTDP-glucose 4,6-dehydratase [Duncaniella sp.]
GRSAHPYFHPPDCLSAIIHILLKGEAGEAYNVATPGTYVTIRQLAELCRDNFNPDIAVTTRRIENSGYAPETTVNLNSDKLLSLGWQPRHSLIDMTGRLIAYLRQ